MGTTCAIVIGNSDGKLTQQQWSAFYADVDRAVDFGAQWREQGFHVHGRFHSLPHTPFQNACWLFEAADTVPADVLDAIRNRLAVACHDYQQESVAWISGVTGFVTADRLATAGMSGRIVPG